MKGFVSLMIGLVVVAMAFGCTGKTQESDVAESPHGDMPADAMEGQQPQNVSAKAAISHAMMASGNMLTLTNPVSGEDVELRFHFVHDGVRETPGGRQAACVDFMDADGTTYDVDFYVTQTADGKFEVTDTVIHKIGDDEVLAAAERERLEQVQ
jgi:hypothetical protein